MADTVEILRFGAELKDQVDLIAGVSDAQLGLLAELIRERANLERDYSAKLLALTKKAQEKKVKRMQGVVLGDEPAKVYTDDTIRSSTLDVAYTQFLTSWEESAGLHATYAAELGNAVAEDLRRLEKRKEETKRGQMHFYTKLVSERDRIYGDRTKSQQKYYDECTEVDSARQKQERFSGHDRHSERVAKQYEQQKVDMLNCKNNYIVMTALANKIKSKFYQVDIPDLENQFQDIQINLIRRLVEVLTQTQTFTKSHLNALTIKNETASAAISKIDTTHDQNMFITFNLRHFTAPADWKFEACPSYYDTATLNTEQTPKIFLQNKLAKAQAKLNDAKAIAENKESEASSIKVNVASEDADDKTDKYLEALHQVTFYKSSVALLEKEVEVVKAALGDDVGTQHPHTFKSSSFSIPTTCEYCHSSIWGLSKQGKTCRSCGISVHAKCEMKVPAQCTGTGGSKSTFGHIRNSLSLSKSDSREESKALSPKTADAPSLMTPTVATPTVATPSSFTTQPHQEEHPTIWATVVFDFTASSPFEISVDEGTRVKVLEEDDGSGWVKIFKESTEKSGLVPASYLKLDSDEDSEDEAVQPELSMPVPSVAQVSRSGKYVVALYDYEAQGDDELALVVGEHYELTSGEHGGEHYGEGWWEGINAHGKQGIFPSNYVQMI
ncbi:hypothetical protein CPB86DRAFT_751530 [Serendipita vermifera]|nr:hypothetical protein CPB86DRAFT_751530 [Serendipita vermifera]